jgi:hypothetical protein
MKVPLLENTWILPLAVSATYTLPDDGSIATPSGSDNCAPGAPCSLKIVPKKESSCEYANGKRYNDEETKVIEIRNSIDTLR